MIRQQMARAVEIAGGEVVQERYVIRPGVFLAQQPGPPSATLRQLGDLWHIQPCATCASRSPAV